ncbi:MAG TPA: multiheme c-type cytochrome, partial [Planctomycetaceae bacterium]
MVSNRQAGSHIADASVLSPTAKLIAALAMIAILSLGVWFTLGIRHGDHGAAGQVQAVAHGAKTDESEPWLRPRGYVGSAACRKCHEEQYASYSETAHSRSMSEIRSENEPADAVFDYSGYRYRT